MSKLWCVHPIYLDDSRLLREHQSIHKLIADAARPAGRESDQRFRNFGGYLIWRHYLAVNELRLRGMRHESFVDGLWKLIPESRRKILYRMARDAIIEDVRSLLHKQRVATTSAGTTGRALLKPGVVPNELNEEVEKVAATGFPKDIFLI